MTVVVATATLLLVAGLAIDAVLAVDARARLATDAEVAARTGIAELEPGPEDTASDRTPGSGVRDLSRGAEPAVLIHGSSDDAAPSGTPAPVPSAGTDLDLAAGEAAAAQALAERGYLPGQFSAVATGTAGTGIAVTVTVNDRVPAAFAALVGVRELPVSGSATARTPDGT